MKRVSIALVLLACIALAGCESKQAKLAALKAQYDPLNKKYFYDCIGSQQNDSDAYFKGTKPKTITPEQEAAHNQMCAQELKQVTDLEQQMQALQK